MRRVAAVAALLLASVVPVAAQDASGWIQQALSDAAPGLCGSRSAAALGTLARLSGVGLPSEGKVVIVNIPSGVVTAYEDGVPVIESRAVVGREATRTPEMQTHVTFVRPNPTWTVPESIIKRKGWRERLAKDPAYFDRAGFEVTVGGQSVSPYVGAEDPSRVTAFVQQPSEQNALGSVKIGIENDQAIYLHDTNEPGGFEEEVRAASSGCVRVERVRELAAWILDVPQGDVDWMIEEGDTANHPPPRPVRVLLGYWTAWPDAEGRMQFYPDIYGLDGSGPACEPGQEDGPTASGSREIWTEYEAR